MIDAVGRRGGAGWASLVALAWLVFAAERLLAYRVVGFGPAALVLHGLGWAAATAATAAGVTALWKRSRRPLAVAAVVLSLLSATAIATVDWRLRYARGFYSGHRQDFAALVDRARLGGPPSGDVAQGPPLPAELAHLSGNGRVGTLVLWETGRRALFLPAGTVGGCTAGYVFPGLEPAFDGYDGCASRTPLGDGWYWTD